MAYKQTYTIYTNWLAAELRNLGFKMVRVRANPHKPELNCYDFIDSKELQYAIKKLNEK